MVHPPSNGGATVNGDTTVNTVPNAMLVTAETVNEVDQEAIFDEGRLAGEAHVRQQMITKAVHAEIVDDPKVDQQRRWRRRLVGIVAAVVGGVVGSQSGGGPKASPSIAPTVPASMAPSRQCRRLPPRLLPWLLPRLPPRLMSFKVRTTARRSISFKAF
jgi:hypothetical protein